MILYTIIELEKQFREVGNVEKVVGLTDIIGTDVPLEMLPDEIKDKLYKDNTTPVLVTFKDGISEDTTMETVEKLRVEIQELEDCIYGSGASDSYYDWLDSELGLQ